MDRQHIYYFDFLRILAACSVVIIHIVAQNWYNPNATSFQWHCFNVCDSLARWCVPVFVMISGALFFFFFQPLKKLYSKNILRLVTAFVFWSLFYTIANFFLFKTLTTRYQFFYYFFAGNYHMWYLYMLVGLYLIVPLLRKIAENRKLALYFVILSFMFASLIPQALEIIRLKSNRIPDMLAQPLANLQLNFVAGYSGYFVLGHLLHTTELKKKQELLLYLLGILGLLTTAAGTAALYIHFKTPMEILYNYLGVNTFFTATAIFYFVKAHWNRPVTFKIPARLIRELSKCSFGIYLIHPFIIEVLRKHGLHTLSLPLLWGIPALFLIVFTLSALSSALITRIPFLNKWLV